MEICRRTALIYKQIYHIDSKDRVDTKVEHLNCSLIKIFIKDNNSPYDLSYQFYAITDYIHFRLYRTMSTKSFHNTVLVTISFSLSSCVNSRTHLTFTKCALMKFEVKIPCDQ